MKKQIILGSFLAFTGILNAQWLPSSSPTGDTYRSGLVGLGSGMTSPADNLHIRANSGIVNSGITIDQYTAGNGGACLKLKYTGDANGREYILGSSGSNNPQGAGHFFLYDTPSDSYRMFVHGPTGNVGIGTTDVFYNKKTRLGAYLNIDGYIEEANGENTAVMGYVDGYVTNNPNDAFMFGVSGTAVSVSNKNYATGVYGKASNSRQNIGGDFVVTGTGGTPAHYGVRSTVNCSSSGTNYGIYASASGGSSNLAGHFVGNVSRTGTDNFTSDRKLKNDIKPLTNSLDKLMRLKPSTYTFKTEEYKAMNLPSGNQMGLIAQDLEQVLPELVTNMPELKNPTSNGEMELIHPEFKTVQYISLIPLLIGGLQEQQSQIETLSATVKKQNEMINVLINKAGTTTGINENNNVPTGFNMEQNIPNPFSNETVINYTVPATVANASMVVYDLSGKQIASFPLTEKGSSSITITSEKLAAGIYIYSVMADGKIIDSKRMVVANK